MGVGWTMSADAATYVEEHYEVGGGGVNPSRGDQSLGVFWECGMIGKENTKI